MLCQHCKKNIATYNYVEIVNGNKFASHLCASCYVDLYGELNSKSNNEIFAKLLGTEFETEKTCPVCGTQYSDYKRSGLLGCASCYDVFKEQLLPTIERIHGRDYHVGKPANNNDELGLHRKLKNLQEQLETALKERRYADANLLNRQINAISKSIYGGGENND